MNWELLTTLLVTVAVATVGWIVVHRLEEARARQNKRREVRTQYLIHAYRILERAAHRPDIVPFGEDLEQGTADVQLFGTTRQVNLAQRFVTEFVERKSADLDELLRDLRADLRNELELDKMDFQITHLRILPKGSNPQR